MRETLVERENFLRIAYDYQEAELAAYRARVSSAARQGDIRAKGELTKIKECQARVSPKSLALSFAFAPATIYLEIYRKRICEDTHK